MIKESPAEADTVGFGVLRASPPKIEPGYWHLSEAPRLGVVWDEEALRRFKVGS
jgi:L-alanine-DL-glutamate epimerase-like enolase superfamily enzyme